MDGRKTGLAGDGVSGDSVLPNKVAATWFVCRCFGIGPREMNVAMRRLRKTDVDPMENFPPMIHGQTIARAKGDDGTWSGVVEALCHRALADRVSWLDGKPLFSFTARFAERFVSLLLRLYERIAPRLDLSGVSKQQAMWVLVEQVFLPTIFVNLVRDWRCGLGDE